MLQQAIERVGKIDRDAIIKEMQDRRRSTRSSGKIKLVDGQNMNMWAGRPVAGLASSWALRRPNTKAAQGRARSFRSRLEVSGRTKPSDDAGQAMLLLDIVLSDLVLGGMYALTAHGAHAPVRRGAHHESRLRRVPGRRGVLRLLAVHRTIDEPAVGLIVWPRRSPSCELGDLRWLLTPLVSRAKSRGQLEVDCILATFGLLFIVQGVDARHLRRPVPQLQLSLRPGVDLGVTLALNRLLALAWPSLIGVRLYLALTRTRTGTAIRAVAVDPDAARLSPSTCATASAFAFALGGALVAAGGVLVSMFLTFNAAMGVVFTMKALIVVIMGGVGNMHGRAGRGAAARACRDRRVARLVDPGLTLAATYALFLIALAGAANRAVREARAVSLRTCRGLSSALVVVVVLAACRWLPAAIMLALAISMLSFTMLATAWALFSGPTHYISLATRCLLRPRRLHRGGRLAEHAALAARAADCAPRSASPSRSSSAFRRCACPASTSSSSRSAWRSSMRQLVTWYEVNINGRSAATCFSICRSAAIYWQLLALTAATLSSAGWSAARGLGWRSASSARTRRRRATAASTPRAPRSRCLRSAPTIMTLTGAIMAPRWTYIDPAIAFNPMLSFQVVIMALLGGAGALFGPVAGRRAAGAAVRGADREFSERLQHPARGRVHPHRLLLPRGVIGLVQERWPGRVAAAEPPARAFAARPAPRGALLTSTGCQDPSAACSAVDDLSFSSSPARSSA